MSTPSWAFQQLRPACVDLCQVALKTQPSSVYETDLVQKLETLRDKLDEISEQPGAIDYRLAEYVFFPLSQVFSSSICASARAIELSLHCVSVLLRTGWTQVEHADLAFQLLLLLNFLVTRDQLGSSYHVRSKQFETSVFSCMAVLFASLKKSSFFVKHGMLDSSRVPAIGHSITVMLDCAKLSPSVESQLSALNAYASFHASLETHEVVSNFLPGIVSSLTKILTPSTQSRRSFKVLVKALEIFHLTLETTFTDSIFPSSSIQNFSEHECRRQLNENSEKLGIALDNIFKLRDHPRFEVRGRIYDLCLLIINKCRYSLRSTIPLALEVSILLFTHSRNSINYPNIFSIAASDGSLLEILHSILYNWIQSLPRILNGADEKRRHQLVDVLSTTLKSLNGSGLGLNDVQNYLETALRNSLTQALDISPRQRLDGKGVKPITGHALFSNFNLFEPDTSDLTAVFCRTEFAKGILQHIIQLIGSIGFSNTSINIARNLLDELHTSRGSSRFVNFWLLFHILQRTRHFDLDLEQLSRIEIVTAKDQQIYDEFHTLAVEIIEDSVDEEVFDWRLQVIALHYLQLEANWKKERYRTSLIDVIFSIINLAASSHTELSRAATQCLNSVAESCGYADTKNLVISNIDYLLNAVSTKFNVLDITPQSSRVLSVMVEFFGSSIIPYLDDIVGSLFDALESFHGYPDVATQIFAVLCVIVEQGASSLYSEKQDPERDENYLRPHSTSNVASLIRKFANECQKPCRGNDSTHTKDLAFGHAVISNDPCESEVDTPKKVFSISAKRNEDVSCIMNDKGQMLHTENQTLALTQGQRHIHGRNYNKKVFDILHKIISLTQHYLPSSTLSTRLSLLSLLSRGLPYMAKKEDKFLPLIHNIWPTLECRLKDGENQAVARVLDVMGLICREAGDFVRPRIHELWPTIIRLHGRTQIIPKISETRYNSIKVSDATSGRRALSIGSLTREKLLLSAESTADSISPSINPPDVYFPTDISILRGALTNFVVGVLNNLKVSDSIFEGLLYDMLENTLPLKTEELWSSMRCVNPDSFWLFMERSSAKANKEHFTRQRSKSPRDIKEVIEFLPIAINH